MTNNSKCISYYEQEICNDCMKSPEDCYCMVNDL